MNSYFQLISLRFYSNFEWEYLLDEKFNSSYKDYPCCILLWTLLCEKWEILGKTWLQSCFSCISPFLCRMVHWKYVTWVLLRWGIKFCIQQVLPLKIWVKNLGDKLKIQVEKVVFSFFPLKFDDVMKYYFIISTTNL